MTIDEKSVQDAIEVIRKAGRVSTAHLQRMMRIGYYRAHGIIEELEKRGVVSVYNEGKPRDILADLDNIRTGAE